MNVTAEDLKAARETLGWSTAQMAIALKLDSGVGGWRKGSHRIREMEQGSRAISGPIAVAVESFLAGHRPGHFDDPGR
jgi:hypothetical protein